MMEIKRQREEILRRTAVKRKAGARRAAVLVGAGGALLSLVILIAAAKLLPEVGKRAMEAPYAAAFAAGSVMPYVLIGVLAFTLGSFVTLACMLAYRRGRSRR